MNDYTRRLECPVCAHEVSPAPALRALAAEWREAYSESIFPCRDGALAQINAAAGPNATATVAASMMRHWADVLERAASQIGKEEVAP